MIPLSDLEYTPEEDEAWNLFLRKFETVKIPQPIVKVEDNEDTEIYENGLFGKSVRSL